MHAVSAWLPYAGSAWAGPGYAVAPMNWNPEEDAQRVLDDTVAQAYGTDPPPSLKLTVQVGGAARVLLEASTDARMLVVGSRGHGGFVGLLLGSVSGACAEHAHCPVLVVHGTTPPPPS